MSDEQRMREAFEVIRVAEYDILSVDRDPETGEYARRSTYEAWGNFIGGWLARDAEVQALERVALNVMASLDAALSILGRSHEGKVPANEAVASDRMFTMMLDDYQKSLDAARAALAGGEEGEAE